MLSKNQKSNVETHRVESTDAIQEGQVAPRSYQTPKLHDVGKATKLVQGGGGGNYLDANRSRYY